MEWQEGVAYRVPLVAVPRTPHRQVRSVSATGVMPDFFAPLGPLQQLSQKNGVFFDYGTPPPSFFSPAAWHLPKVLILQSASA